MTWTEERMKIAGEAASFPSTFGLRAFPGSKFRINIANSYVNGESVILCIDRHAGESQPLAGSNGIAGFAAMWQNFSKGSPEELHAQIVEMWGPFAITHEPKTTHDTRLEDLRRVRAAIQTAIDALEYVPTLKVTFDNPLNSAMKVTVRQRKPAPKLRSGVDANGNSTMTWKELHDKGAK